MFRSAASLLARKTAIVAITGVTVIGGATLALAAGDSTGTEETSVTSSEIVTMEECEIASGTWDDAGETCTLPDPEPVDCDPTTETCPDPEPVDCDPTTETCPDPEPVDCDPATETCPDPEPVDCDPTTETCPDPEGGEGAGEDAVHPENHGKYVSDAARACKETAPEGEPTTHRNHGQCVRAVAQSQEGKKAKPTAKDDAAGGETTQAEDTSEDEVEPAPEVVTETPTEEEPAAAAPAPEKGKPAHAGPPADEGDGGAAGKGKGPKG